MFFMPGRPVFVIDFRLYSVCCLNSLKIALFSGGFWCKLPRPGGENMKITSETRTCQHCKRKFIPDCRNRHHQRFCTKPPCRLASKKHSQAKWLAKNPGFFSGAENVLRVQIWRQEHGRGRGRRIFKMVLELLIFRREGRSESVKIVKKDGNGHVLQDVCELKNSIKTRGQRGVGPAISE